MSVLLFVVVAITFLVGVGAIGFGIPINEFSFGNTLIVAGMTAAVGGLIVCSLGAVIAHLHRLTETLADAAARSTGTVGAFEPPVAGHARAARIPFPSPQPPDAPAAAAPPFAPVAPPVGPAPVGA